jgi:hypothetical protein
VGWVTERVDAVDALPQPRRSEAQTLGPARTAAPCEPVALPAVFRVMPHRRPGWQSGLHSL